MEMKICLDGLQDEEINDRSVLQAVLFILTLFLFSLNEPPQTTLLCC